MSFGSDLFHACGAIQSFGHLVGSDDCMQTGKPGTLVLYSIALGVSGLYLLPPSDCSSRSDGRGSEQPPFAAQAPKSAFNGRGEQTRCLVGLRLTLGVLTRGT